MSPVDDKVSLQHRQLLSIEPTNRAEAEYPEQCLTIDGRLLSCSEVEALSALRREVWLVEPSALKSPLGFPRPSLAHSQLVCRGTKG